METYYIHEDNLERLEKQITAIRNKCKKNDLDFHYEVGEPVFREYTRDDNSVVVSKFYPVQVQGSIKHADWEFAATIDHSPKSNNIVRAYIADITIPDKYYTCGPTCEHCNKIRSRKDTYLVYNTTTQEFKQVGKSCMKEYTQGLDAEEVARYISLFDKMIQGEAPSGSSHTSYKSTQEILSYAFECVKHFGYHNSESQYSTRQRISDYMWAKSSSAPEAFREKMRDEQEKVGFDIDSEDTVKYVNDSLEWIRNMKDVEFGYMSNLKAACEADYFPAKDMGIVVSLSVTYLKHIEKEAERAEKDKAVEAQRSLEANSKHVGTIGQRITISVASFNLVSTFDSIYGMSWLYKFLDDEGNVYIWYASNPLTDGKEVATITGAVKAHTSYNGIDQTQLTRCKVTYV